MGARARPIAAIPGDTADLGVASTKACYQSVRVHADTTLNAIPLFNLPALAPDKGVEGLTSP